MKRTLSEAKVNERRDLLVARIAELEDIEVKQSAQVKKWNETKKLLGDQISVLASEVRDRTAWVSAQLALDERPEDEDEATAPGKTRPAPRGKKAAASKKKATSSGRSPRGVRAARVAPNGVSETIKPLGERLPPEETDEADDE